MPSVEKAEVAAVEPPSPLRRRVRFARREAKTGLRMLGAGRRELPGYLILGTAKGGTTSLHEYLCQHPRVGAPTIKEIHYFDHAYGRGERWYRAHFPLRRSGDTIVGEATPYYLFHPRVPALVARDLPDCRLIAVLRDPVERAISHHNHERADGFETLPLEAALDREAERLAGEEERLERDPRYRSFAHQHHSYVARGLYAEQLERWFRHFDRERVMAVASEQLFGEPQATVERVGSFLGLEPIPPDDIVVRNARTYPPTEAKVRVRLRARFAEPNARLYELLGEDFGWP